MSRYTRIMLALLIVDACLVLFLSFGAVFPSHLALPAPGSVLPDEFYDFTAKASPLGPVRKASKRAATAVKVNDQTSRVSLASLKPLS